MAPRIMNTAGISILLLISYVSQSYSFTFTSVTNNKNNCKTLRPSFLPAKAKGFEPSKVEDDEGPTPPQTSDPILEIDPSTIKEMQYSKDVHPVPDQPWRRGDTDGCEDPIYVEWRVEAERLITEACTSVGAKLAGVTWGMSQCIVSIEDYSEVEGIIDGPEVIIDSRDDYDEQLGPDLTWNPSLTDEEFEEYIDTHPRSQVETLDDPMYDIKQNIDTTALSAVAEAITLILSEPSIEKRLRVLSRHELILTQPSEFSGVLESQKDFDANRGRDVSVETRDPFKSNRTLQGKLVARTALDIIINIDGNMVTIPNNFVYQVTLDEDTTLQYEA